MDSGMKSRANAVKKGMKGGTKPSRVQSLVNAAAKSAGYGTQTTSATSTANAVKKNGKGSKKKFK